ncbi:lycopene cyclase [Halobellus sp. Atlit-38R]|jgi:lycopene cyclase domain-containing protein|uniref:lycopene cyclase n=1 Tax=Halobellus sp. Atlit-38R TaxID=2282131 RepID=UPI000EF1765A|nr:lycopene cyclase [Halobellus sp. Atlit-38R]RLM89833.1 lycopene cyclase [Halobellus sp. Atlit-38R]
MAFARQGSEERTDLGALLSQVHPVFMLPPLAASGFGAVLAGSATPAPLVLHALATFFAVYTAHVKDGYVDFYRRGEDDDHPMSEAGCRRALACATLGFGIVTALLGTRVGVVAAVVTVPMWLLGFFHAPQFDTNPVTTTLGYPLGIALAIVGGHYAQAGQFGAEPLGFALVFLTTLAGVKIVDDSTDYQYDRSIGKRTVAVALGLERARRLAYALLYLGFVFVVLFAVGGPFPASAPLAAVAFGIVALVATRADATVATMLLVRGAYVFLAFLVVAVWYRPLAAVPLPDIGLLGPYTYLATEIAFGTLALALLVYADALRRAAVTILALYPLAYVWDWYTLEIGVFAIPLRTGVELLGIPVEEHLFMLVVPALVIGIHETVNGRGRAAAADERE